MKNAINFSRASIIWIHLGYFCFSKFTYFLMMEMQNSQILDSIGSTEYT